jgi:hypothetical protein
METWHDRLDFALKKRGKKWAELVVVTELSKPSVYAWRPNAKKRTEMMNGDNAAVVCEWLQINSKWLFEGTGESGLDLPTGDAPHESPITPSPAAEVERGVESGRELPSELKDLPPEVVSLMRLIESSARGGELTEDMAKALASIVTSSKKTT